MPTWKPSRAEVNAAAAQPAELVLACVRLQEQRINKNPKFKDQGSWFPFGSQNLPPETLYNECKDSPCSQTPAVLALLQDVCLYDLKNSADECGKLKKEPKVITKVIRPPLPTWRRAVGGVLIGVGVGSVLLGAVHMGVPLFHTETGCVQYGLAHPCVADRFGLGGALLGLGLAATGGGILALTLP